MTIFSRNIVKEYSVTWAVIFAALLMIVFVTQLVRYLGYAATGSVPFGSVFLLLALGSVKNLPVLFSLSIILSVTLSLSRWYRDSEMVVWASSGKSLSAICISLGLHRFDGLRQRDATIKTRNDYSNKLHLICSLLLQSAQISPHNVCISTKSKPD
mgnify:CR=1 FL=1